ncbi:hypothetical protein [Methylobacterium haplocladii]|uniref:Uncharacterized protein n=1 Tax=Methylobacterium haplocladii TaxID=1176176 RepID=A0A512ILF6_9HYPH|nr:hypothetical protein [Methylobacterium haplocladii]GEO98553.1 hypothetical protein MHA02_09410 [Methylobacterium haplocladii]GJD85166.1 hypothetical protein HPGCJGGD_3052 [Methylobacterium haplocladii]GLS59899.1 hypothetical protein GCM10007887_25720 [Methylobacterium haplocladii]
MRFRTVLPLVAVLILPIPARALTMSDPLTAWVNASAMDRMQLATRFGKSFIALNESFTSGYFLKCIDDISTYGGAKDARIEDAMRECVASQQRLKGSPADDD